LEKELDDIVYHLSISLKDLIQVREVIPLMHCC